MQQVGGGPIKIGFSDDVDYRRKQLEKKYKRQLVVLAVIPGDKFREKQVHEQFSHLRFGKREQFKPAPDLLHFIGRPLLATADPESIEEMASTEKIKPIAFQVRGSLEWKAALEVAAEFDGKSIAALADHAIRWYARQIGFPEAIPKR